MMLREAWLWAGKPAAAKPIKLTPKEKRLVVEMGGRWLGMSIDEILSENAILFRLAVAIVGHKGKHR
jgi:hypothetical protein